MGRYNELDRTMWNSRINLSFSIPLSHKYKSNLQKSNEIHATSTSTLLSRSEAERETTPLQTGSGYRKSLS